MSITSTMSMSSTHIKSTGSSRPPSLEFGSKRNSRCSNRYSSASVGGVSGGIPENEPLSPSGYEQPPTPDHPPPSPMTAILGIQEKINPNVCAILLKHFFESVLIYDLIENSMEFTVFTNILYFYILLLHLIYTIYTVT